MSIGDDHFHPHPFLVTFTFFILSLETVLIPAPQMSLNNQGWVNKWKRGEISEPEKQKRVRCNFIIFEIKQYFYYNLKLFQMQMVLSSSTVPLQLIHRLNSSNSHTGLRKMLYYFKYKIGPMSFCFSGPGIPPLLRKVFEHYLCEFYDAV
jgi:hypothetical protein